LKKRTHLIFLILLLIPSLTWARHIVGGEITYRLVSSTATSNRFEFTMRIYRDCNSRNGAAYDERAVITTYRKNAGSQVESTYVPVGPITKVTKPSYPCLISPDICVEEGVYVWTRDFPKINDTYLIVYQRCCRNESISNIINPGAAGASYTVEITAQAQQVGNSSPTFKQFPPTVICGNFPLNFDHSAIDSEGDQLVYSFCEPYAGGGQASGVGCINTAPDPACWPPFGTIAYKQPEYTYQNPVGGDPIVSINPNTGLITGTPNQLGQFVVSVCVEEYRNGKLLSIIKRDFQFNVASCNPTVKASIASDTIINKVYVLQTCGEKFINIANRSNNRSDITDFRFDINIKGENITYKDWDPKVQFPDTGTYKGSLFLNPGTQCADTIQLQFNIFSSLIVNFAYKYDTCVAGPVTFTDSSKTFNGGITQYYWTFGDDKDTFARNPVHLYETPGTKRITLKVTDTKGCKQDTVRQINWQPAPPLIVIKPSVFTGCTPAKVTFTNLSRPIDSTYTIRWTLGDGSTSNAISPTYTYQNPGLYSINIDITSPIGCKISRNFKDLIRINQGAKADFEFSPQKITKLQNSVTFTDKSQFVNRWQWSLNDKAFSSRQNPSYTFRDTGLQKVKLFVANQVGCSDTLVKFLDVIPEVSYFLPNAFTPNNDAINDIFKGNGLVDGMKSFNMKIWNRWGELIYEGTDPNGGWNGRKFNTGGDAPEGVYLCVVTYVTPRGEVSTLRSYATLIR
jgi:gliding motility-associated-like protein